MVASPLSGLYLLIFAGCFMLAQPQMVVNVGGTVSLTGMFASSGQLMQNAARLFEEVPAHTATGSSIAGGIRIQTTLLDDGSDIANVEPRYVDLANNGIQFYLGPFTTELSIVAMQAVQGVDAVFLAPSASGPNAIQGFANSFGISQAAGGRLFETLTTLQRRGATSVLFVTQPYAALVEACSINATALGYNVIAPIMSLGIAPTVGVDAIADNISSFQPDLVVFCTRMSVMEETLNVARRRNINIKGVIIIGQLDANQNRSKALLQASPLDVVAWAPRLRIVEGIIGDELSCTSWSSHGCITPQDFADLYAQKYGIAPTVESAATFACLEILDQAINMAGTADVNEVLHLVREATFDTVYGRVTFNKFTHMNSARHFTRQLLGGSLEVVFPSAAARASLSYPNPTWAKLECEASNHCSEHGSCTDTGDCVCPAGYGGSRCQLAYGLPLFILAILLGCVLIVGLVVWRQKSHMRSKQQAALAALQAENDAKQAGMKEAHGRLLSYARHEIANPLFALTGILEGAAADTRAGEDLVLPHEDVIALQTAAQQIRRVLQEMTFAAGQRLHQPVVESNVDVRNVVRDVMHRLNRVHEVKVDLMSWEHVPESLSIDALGLYEILLMASVHVWHHMLQVGLDHNSIGLKIQFVGDLSDPSPRPSSAQRVPLRSGNDMDSDSTCHSARNDHYCPGKDGGALLITLAPLGDEQKVAEWQQRVGPRQHHTSLQIDRSKIDDLSPRTWNDINDLLRTHRGHGVHDCENLGHSCMLSVPAKRCGSSAGAGHSSSRDTVGDHPHGASPPSAEQPVSGVMESNIRPIPASLSRRQNSAHAVETVHHIHVSAAETQDIDLGLSPIDPLPAKPKGLPQVLIVEDDRTNRKLVSKMVTSAKWDYVMLEDGADIHGLESSMSADFSNFQCVLMDIVMPRSNGVQVGKHLRQIGYRGYLVAMTANSGDDDRKAYTEAGFDAVLAKPFGTAELRAVLRTALANKTASQAGLR